MENVVRSRATLKANASMLASSMHTLLVQGKGKMPCIRRKKFLLHLILSHEYDSTPSM